MSEDIISRKQLLIMAFISVFSPAVRILPRFSIQIGGAVVWLSPIIAAAASIGLAAVMAWLMKNRREGEGMGDLILHSIGPAAGRAVLGLTALWLTFYAGFILRISAERLLASVFERGRIGIFVVMTLGVSVIAAFGRIRSLARTAEVMMILGLLSTVVVLFSLADLRAENLLPIRLGDIKGIVLGALPMVDLLSIFVYFMFLTGHCKKRPGAVKQTSAWICATAFGFFIIMLTTIGTMSAGLVETMQNPFFSMIKNITIFGIVERIEAVIVAMWVITDFILLSVLIITDSEIIRLTLPKVKRRTAVLPISIAVLAAAVTMTSSVFGLRELSERVMPLVNICFTVLLLPGSLVIGKLRHVI